MTRTARSPIFSQSHDFTCFVVGAGGDIIAQADGIPIHSGGGGFAVHATLREFGEEMAEGDVYLLSDPYKAGGCGESLPQGDGMRRLRWLSGVAGRCWACRVAFRVAGSSFHRAGLTRA